MSPMLEQELSELGLELFGTADFESALAVLPPYDRAVKEFWKRAEDCRKEADVHG